MRIVRGLLSRGWRALFVVAVSLLPLFIISHITAGIPAVLQQNAVSLSGVRYKEVTFIPVNQQLGNSSVQAVQIHSKDAGLDAAINGAIQAKVADFTRSLPGTPAVAGFFHQLRIVPRIDYSGRNAYSVTLQTDEYHPSGIVTTRFDSWTAEGSLVTQPVLDGMYATQLSKVLQVPKKDILPQVGMPMAMGILPDYKLRLYSSGALARFIAPPYRDVSLTQLPALAKIYRKAFYATYPQTVSADMQAELDTGYARAMVRTDPATDCAIESCLALTFDDGPDPVITPKVLKILEDSGVKATFFEMGSQVQHAPDMTKRVAAAGHEIEDHSFSHPDFVKLHYPELIRKQIDDTQGALNAVGVGAKFLRPPYGSIDDNVKAVANMPLILWNVDAQEWRPGTTPQAMTASIISQARPGAIILMHDTRPITADALPATIKQLEARNFRFVTVAQLLQIDGGARGVFASRP